jgi:hypothetical protein
MIILSVTFAETTQYHAHFELFAMSFLRMLGDKTDVSKKHCKLLKMSRTLSSYFLLFIKSPIFLSSIVI